THQSKRYRRYASRTSRQPHLLSLFMAWRRRRHCSIQEQVAPLLLPQQRIRTLEDASPPLFQALDKAQQYLNLTSLVAILLASVGIALSATYFAQQRLQQAAL